jgi:diguanylate cyclase (GGDEF)-like protein
MPAIAGRVRWWRRVSLRQQMVYGFAIPVLVVLLASLYVAMALESMRDAARESIASSQATNLRYALLNLVVDAETGLRGYLLTSDPEFLEPFDTGSKLEGISRQLDVSEKAEPEHLRKLREVQALFKRWRSDFAEPLIRLRHDAPIGIDDDLEQLVELATTPRTPEQQRALDHAREQAQVALMRSGAGGRAVELQPLLEKMESDPVLDPVSLATLRKLAQAYRHDDEQITTIVQTKRGKRIIDQIRTLMKASLEDEQDEQRRTVDTATASTDRARWIARLVPAGALIIGLSLVLLLLVDAIRAIGATTKAAEAVAGGDLDKRVKVLRGDELGSLGHAFNRMAAELADRRRRGAALDRFQTLLISSNSMEELYDVVARLCTELFPGSSGAVYRIAASRNLADRVGSWNWPEAANGRVLEPQECRAIRTGQPYFLSSESLEVPCRHTEHLGVSVGRSACLPLSAHGEILGILQLCRFDEVRGPISQPNRATAVLIAEQLAMAMANLQLREQLRQQSIRDPLTGLFNRRYLEETMERELARSARNGQPLAVVAIDVDHFKRFNDTHGHEAGDHVLVELARLLRESVRNTDIACRYGGEEFVLLMPDSPLSVAIERVEMLRTQVSALRLQFGGGQHEPVTISIGLATAPEDGHRADVLLRNADTALYAAKAGGRNRLVVYQAP